MNFFKILLLGSVVSAAPQYFGPGDGARYEITPYLVSDGQPCQKPMYKQVTTGVECGKRNCSMSRSDQQTYTVGWNIVLNQRYAKKAAIWFISGEFDVSEATSTGQVATCSGGWGETVCVWWRTSYTGNLVQNWKQQVGHEDTAERDGDEY
ncbi:Fc.00g033610.m01.CDS01 [Cosmosporella sp. VM-42]